MEYPKQRDKRSPLSGYMGVSWDKSKERWQVYIRSKFVGNFTCKHMAARAWNAAALETWGPNAKLNDVPPPEPLPPFGPIVHRRCPRDMVAKGRCGYRGIYFYKGRYVAQCAGRYLGRYDTPEEASAAYQRAAVETWGELPGSET